MDECTDVVHDIYMQWKNCLRLFGSRKIISTGQKGQHGLRVWKLLNLVFVDCVHEQNFMSPSNFCVRSVQPPQVACISLLCAFYFILFFYFLWFSKRKGYFLGSYGLSCWMQERDDIKNNIFKEKIQSEHVFIQICTASVSIREEEAELQPETADRSKHW